MKLYVKISILLTITFFVIFPSLNPARAQSDSLQTPTYLKYYLSGLDKSISKPFDQRAKVNFRYSPEWLTYAKSRLKRNIDVDTNANYVVITETVYDGVLIRKPLVLSIDEYLHRTIKNNTLKYWFTENIKEVSREDRITGGAGGLVPDIAMPVELKGKVFDWLYVWSPDEQDRTAGRLRVTGYQKISFGGTSDWSDKKDDINDRQSKFPKLDMEQELKVHLSGKVGDKIEVLVDHDSTRDQLNKNTIRIRYEGDEDEIIQEIEAGDTNLSLGSSPKFVSSGFSTKGLFGVKSALKVGNLDVTLIASKEESETRSKRFEGKSERTPKTKKDFEYIRNRFYYVDQPDILLESPDGGQTLPNFPEPSTIRLWVDDNNQNDEPEFEAIAYTDPQDTTNTDQKYNGRFRLLESPDDYLIDVNSYLMTIQLKRALGNNDVLGVSYVTQGGDTIGFGNPIVAEDVLILKILKPQTPEPEYKETWEREAKNFYDFGQSNIEEEGFTLKIIKDNGAGEPDTSAYFHPTLGGNYTEILNLDIDGDGKLDNNTNIDFYSTGILQFPIVMQNAQGETSIEPWPFAFSALGDSSYINSRIYNHREAEIEKHEANYMKYKLVAEFKTARSVYSLGTINIVEGSETVKKGNTLLVRDKDYRIIYETGTVTLINDPNPGEEISIDFEYSPFMAQSQKTLLGMRAQYNLSKNSSIGTTWMYKSEKMMEKRPRVGNESSRYIVGDVDIALELKPSIMTDMVNWLPFIDTDTQSSLTFKGEAAISMPNPNTKGEAYIDDMEGIEQTNTIGITYSGWVPASVPPPKTVMEDTLAMAKVRWYNPEDDIYRDEINLQTKGTDEGNDRQEIMHLEYIPKVESDTLELSDSWGGIMKLISKGGTDFEEMKYLEIWLDPGTLQEGQLHFDLGTDVSEDFRVRGVGMSYGTTIPVNPFPSEDLQLLPSAGNLNTEDIIITDGQKDIGEDEFGIDGIKNGEPYDDGTNNPEGNPNLVNGDDHWDYDSYKDDDNPEKWKWINGTEENQRLDTEDLNGNERLDLNENFYRYTIDLSDTSTYIIQDNSRIEPDNHWRMYQIPLAAVDTTFGSPKIYEIRSFRMWMTGIEDSVRLRIASIEVAGNKWLDNNIRYARGSEYSSADSSWVPDSDVPEDLVEWYDESFDITVKNTRDHMEYRAPSGVDIQRDDNDNPEREQSIAVRFENLHKGHYASAYLDPPAALDLMNYQTFSFYVNGFKQDNGTDIHADSVEFFVRLGSNAASDTTDYYEFRKTINLLNENDIAPENWGKEIKNNWQEINVDFTSWTWLKPGGNPDVPDSITYNRNGVYIWKGSQATLTAIKRITVGIISKDEVPASGEIWIDDIRLTNVNREKGFATYGEVSASFADLLRFNLDVRWEDSEFTTLSGSSSSGTQKLEKFSYGLRNVRLQLDKFLPDSWGINMPLTGSITKTIEKPKLQTRSDIELSDEESDRQRTETTNTNVSFDYKKTQKSKNTFVNFLVDPLSFGIKATKREKYSPTAIDSSVNYNGYLNYSFTFGDHGFNIPLLGRFSYMPSRITTKLSYAESRSIQYVLTGENKVANEREPASTIKTDADLTYNPLKTIKTSYNISLQNDRAFDGDTEIFGFNLGTETDRTQRISGSYNPTLPSMLSAVKPNFSYNTTYTERNSDIAIVGSDSTAWQRNVSNQNNAKVDLTLDFRTFLNQLQSALRIESGGKKKPNQKKKPITRGDYEDGEAPPPFEDLEKEKKDEKEKEEKEKSESEDGGSLNPVHLMFGGLSSVFEKVSPLNGSYQLARTSSFRDVSDRPGWNYQLGIDDSLGNIDGIFDRRSETATYSLGSGLRLFSNLNISGNYEMREDNSWDQTSATTLSSVTWPRVTINFSQLERYPLIRSLVTSASLNSGYTVKNDEKERMSGEKMSETKNISWQPLIKLSSTWFKKLKFDVGINKSNAEAKQYSGAVMTPSETETTNYDATFNYSFSAKDGFSIPLWKLREKIIKFSSDLRIQVPFRYKKTEKFSEGDLKSGSQEYSINPSLSYDFSKSITGGLRSDYRKTKNLKDGITTNRVNVNIWMQFNF